MAAGHVSENDLLITNANIIKILYTVNLLKKHYSVNTIYNNFFWLKKTHLVWSEKKSID